MNSTETSKERIVHEKIYSLGEEIANSITHGIGTILAIAALVLLINRAVAHAPEGFIVPYVVGFTIYGVSLIVLYSCSTLYHAFVPSTTKKVFAILDHSAIYILIAGTYTALCLSVLYGTLGWVLFGIIWFLATLGIVFYAIYQNRVKWMSFALYLLMGWLVLFAWKPLYDSLSALSLNLLFLGGIAYTLGCIFFLMKKIPWMHSVWHLFVLAGSILHFFSIYFAI